MGGGGGGERYICSLCCAFCVGRGRACRARSKDTSRRRICWYTHFGRLALLTPLQQRTLWDNSRTQSQTTGALSVCLYFGDHFEGRGRVGFSGFSGDLYRGTMENTLRRTWLVVRAARNVQSNNNNNNVETSKVETTNDIFISKMPTRKDRVRCNRIKEYDACF